MKNEAMAKEMSLRADLTALKIPARNLHPDNVLKTYENLMAEREAICNAPRRTCTVPSTYCNDPEVLGKIGQLALVADERIAGVLSWHMSSDMDCIVTLTTKKAMDIHAQTGGRQQLLPIDSIYRKSLPDWKKPLPHTKFKPNWSPPGAPVYARDVLKFPKEAMYCRIVFGMLLGDTLIFNDLDSANAYRKLLIQHAHCPTILTCDGDRIRSNGKFGGQGNKACSIDKLKGVVFGEPLPDDFDSYNTKIEKLHSYQQAIAARVKAEGNLAEQEAKMKSGEADAKVKELDETKTRLTDIENKIFGLDEKSKSAKKRDSTTSPAAPMESPPSKRPRMKASTPATSNHRPAQTTPSPVVDPHDSLNTTPTRKSNRIAADPRIRNRKSSQ